MRQLLFLLLFGFAFGKIFRTGPYPLKVNRRLPELGQSRVHYKHDPKDMKLIETYLMIGSGMQMGDYVVDTIAGDLEVTLCSRNPTPEDGPCYDWSGSYSFERRSDHTASDTVLNNHMYIMSNITFATRKAPTSTIGNLGLGGAFSSKYPGETSFPLDFLSGSERKKFSLSIGLNDCDSGMDFDGNDMCKEGANTLYLPTSSSLYWQFSFTQIAFGDLKFAVAAHMVVDTTKEYIGMPRKYLVQFTKAHNIVWDGLYGAYTVDCEMSKTLPDMVLKVQGGTLTIKAAQYVYTKEKLSNGKCVLNFEDSKAFGFGPSWYFGVQLLESYCVSFDYDNKKIGFTENDDGFECTEH
ncbi:hypothetical protein QR680_003981 [Steinernema hermaphroditum]|uniref:Peptidase A1 domain-containing protein n=1 Tax=Steinernema hermaphroditum TaxID=289476 RepID=A0AA39HPJ4_9BILA|nr:hypothetical protein QR680_003981 [Steinernema hermaphroditum]